MKAIDVEEFAQTCFNIEKDQKEQGNYANALFISELRKMISTYPTVDAVPLDKLCEWLARNAFAFECEDCEKYCEALLGCENEVGSNPEYWKNKLSKWMEEQDAKEEKNH